MMLEVPVVLDFDYTNVIGTLSIDADKLPITPNFVFSIGYQKYQDLGYVLKCASLMSDESYLKYLESRNNE